MDRGIKILAAGIGFLFLLIIIASISNSGKYYIKPYKGNLEIWKGRFAPLGEALIVSMPNVEPPEELKDIYTKKEVYPLVFDFYLDKADQMLETKRLPDFEGIKDYASKALDFSTTPKERTMALARLNKIDQLILIYKADVAYSRGTVESLEQALDHLQEADKIDDDQVVTGMITEKINKITEALSVLKGENTPETDSDDKVMEEEQAEPEAEAAPSPSHQEEQAAHESNDASAPEEVIAKENQPNEAEHKAEAPAKAAH